MKKRILIFSLGYYPMPVGGAEVAIKEITDRISPEEYEFHMICNRYDSAQPKEEQVGSVMVHRIGLVTKKPTITDLRKLPLHLNKPLYQWLAFWKARRLHRQYQFSGIWAMMAHTTGVPAAKFKRLFPDVGFVLTLQEGDPPKYIEQKMRIFWPWFTRAFTSADRVQVISNFLGAWATSKGYQGKPILIPNAVDVQYFSAPAPVQLLQSIKQELQRKPGEKILITTSRLVPKNAVDTVIRAVPTLPDTVRFVVVGDGPDEEKLRVLAETLQVSDRVSFLGAKPNEQLPAYLQASDIFIRPSRSEGMGNSFIEAMAAGLPVIATQAGGIADFLFDEVKNPAEPTTGWAVDVDSPKQIAEAVSQILNQPEQVTRVTATASAMVREKYDWNQVATRMKTEVFDVITSF